MWQLLGHPLDLPGVEEPHLRGLNPRAAEADAGRPGQQFVLDRHVEHAPKGPEVAMDGAGRQSLAKFVVDPGTNLELANPAHGNIAEAGQDVPA
ncbi:MAG: hypothetical protein ACRD1K_16385 [Acidimicrobiales bacterium]